MKLRDLNCVNCNGPLKQEGDKLVCSYCGGTFDIQKDASDIAYENIENAEEYIRMSLEKSTAALEAHYSEMNAKKEEEYRLKREEEKIKGRKDLLRTIRMLLLFPLIISALFGLLLWATEKSQQRKIIKERNEKEAKAEAWNPGSRLTPAEFDDELYDELRELIIEHEEDEDNTVRIASDDIWNKTGEPEITDAYIISTDTNCYVYAIVKNTMESNSGETKDVYDCVYFWEFEMNRKGKAEGDMEVFTGHSSTYDFFWHADLDYDNLKKELIEDKLTDKYKKYYIFDISDKM